jgi:hypothetical protein
MRSITTTSGIALPLDGDLLAMLEALYKELSTGYALDRTFEDTVREIAHLLDQMTDEERRAYLAESLFLNTVTYENERLGAYVRKVTENA